jgi:hypothetical protein
MAAAINSGNKSGVHANDGVPMDCSFAATSRSYPGAPSSQSANSSFIGGGSKAPGIYHVAGLFRQPCGTARDAALATGAVYGVFWKGKRSARTLVLVWAPAQDLALASLTGWGGHPTGT